MVVGTPVANRQRTEVEALIGFFVNTLALRVQLGEDPSVADLLAQVKASTLAAYSHQDLPFEQVVEALRPPRSSAHSPLFQVLLTLNSTLGARRPALHGLALEEMARPPAMSPYDLTLALDDSGDAIGGSLAYACDLFDESTIARMLSQYQQVLGAMVADERRQASALTVLDTVQREQLLALNPAATAMPEALLPQLFEQQARLRPDAIALRFDGQSLSYAALNQRANRLAHHLRSLGVGPDARVGLCLERGVDMVVALLGVLKVAWRLHSARPGLSGGPHRLHGGRRRTGPGADRGRAGRAQLPGLSWPQLVLDGEADAAAISLRAGTRSGCRDCRAWRLSNLAYVIYTSGSTGLPKGVMVEHGNLRNFLHSMAIEPGIAQDDTLLAITTLSFDIAALELYLPLTHGACVMLASRTQASDA
ncbi:AMP-binding protein [Massilia sp. B-10]|nr:AMP-binding protein [Massilia sp. B-10]